MLENLRAELEFTPLEFETVAFIAVSTSDGKLEFTPLEFEMAFYSALS